MEVNLIKKLWILQYLIWSTIFNKLYKLIKNNFINKKIFSKHYI